MIVPIILHNTIFPQVQGGGGTLERKSSFLSDGTFESISESETSTAPSSLQTIIRAPYVLAKEEAKETADPAQLLSSATALRKVSEQLLNTSRTRGSVAALSTPQMSSRLPVAATSVNISNRSLKNQIFYVFTNIFGRSLTP